MIKILQTVQILGNSKLFCFNFGLFSCYRSVNTKNYIKCFANFFSAGDYEDNKKHL